MNANRKKKTSKTEWFTLTGLLLLSLVPMLAGAARMTQLAGGAEITPENARFFASPLPVIVHIIGSTLFAVLGAFQFPHSIRHRWPRWHRSAGRILAPAGLASALSGLWMTQFYPWPEGDGELLYGMRLVFGSAMLLSIILSLIAIRRRDFRSHGDWMIRGYAIGLGAGTQVFTHLSWTILDGGTPDEFTKAMIMGAGWVINIIIAEWVIRKKRTQQPRPKRATSASI